MNSGEARFVLQARRPDGSDDAEPQFREALEQARRDPALAGWLARERAFDEAVAEKLREVRPPAGLREAILAGARASRPAPFRRGRQAPAVAAVLAVVLGLAAAWPAMRREPDIGRLALGVMEDVETDAHHRAMPRPRGVLRQVLADPSRRLAAGLPLDFDRLRAGGCRSVEIGGREVLEVCFERGGEFHLYVARRDAFKGGRVPMFRERGALASVAWTDERLAYVLVSAGGTEALRAVF